MTASAKALTKLDPLARLAERGLVVNEAEMKVLDAGYFENYVAGYRRTAKLLGGKRVLHTEATSVAEVHELIRHGLPGRALLVLLKDTQQLAAPEVLSALDISARTRDRIRRAPQKRLAPGQSDRLWRFAEVLATAIEVFGSREAAEDWLKTPVMALDGQVPLELLSSAPGAQLVEDLLTRLRFNVYT